MAFRASNILPSKGYESAKSNAWRIKERCDYFISTANAGDVGYDFLRTVRSELVAAQVVLSSAATVFGISDYAKIQEGDDTYDVALEFTAMLTTLAGAIAWIDSSVPTSVTAANPAQWDALDTMISTTFTSVQTAGFRVELQKVSDAVI
jgi:hypothetical protein